MPIECPAMESTYEFEGEIRKAQGFVSLPNCIVCQNHKGNNAKSIKKERKKKLR